MVASAQVPVPPPDDPDIHVGQFERSHVQDEPAELAREPVVLAASRLQDRDLARRLHHRSGDGDRLAALRAVGPAGRLAPL